MHVGTENMCTHVQRMDWLSRSEGGGREGEIEREREREREGGRRERGRG